MENGIQMPFKILMPDHLKFEQIAAILFLYIVVPFKNVQDHRAIAMPNWLKSEQFKINMSKLSDFEWRSNKAFGIQGPTVQDNSGCQIIPDLFLD